LQVRPNWPTTLEVLVCCQKAHGNQDEARRCARQLAGLAKPSSDVFAPLKARNRNWHELMQNALRKASE